jgi:hypothetical protein
MSATKVIVASFGLFLFIWLVPGSIEIASWSRSGIDRVALFAPLYTLWIALVAAAVFAAIVWWGGSTSRRDVRAHIVAPFGALWLTTIPFAPWLPDRFPLLMLLTGPLRWVIASAAALTVLVRLRRRRLTTAGLSSEHARSMLRAKREWRFEAMTVFAVSLAIFLVLGFKSLSVVGLGGDEPHYLVITHSLLADHDIKIENNHARGDYRAFFPGDLRPDYLVRGVNGEIYSIHAPGLAAAMLPGYTLAGSRGAVATLCLFAALAAAMIFRAALLLAGPSAAWATWASVCLSVPFVPHAWSLYPEIAGAAIVACVVVWSMSERVPGALVWLGRGALVACLPWLHTKFAVLLAAITLWLLFKARGKLRESAAFLFPIAISGVSWLAFFYVIYGTIDPQAPYGQHTAQFVRMENVPRSILGLLFDQKFGLFVYSPIYLAAIAGAWFLLREKGRRAFAWFIVLTTVGYWISSAREYMWWGGSSAPARYLVPIVPLMAAMIAAAFGKLARTGRSALVMALAGASVLITAVSVASFDRALLFSEPHGTARLFRLLQGSAPLTAAFPTFTDENWTAPLVRTLPWLVAGGIAIGVAMAGQRRSRFWTLITAATTFVVVSSALALPIPADARLEAATDGRMALMTAFDPAHLRAFDYGTHHRMTPAEWLNAGGVTIDLDPSQPVDGYGRLAGPLALAPGAYTATVWFQGSRQRDGDLLLALGNSQMLRRVEGPLPNPTSVSFEMPVAIPSLWIQLTEVATAQQAVRVEIKPADLVPASERLHVDAHAVEMVPGRPNAYMEYIDEWTFPEGGVFWTRGTGTGTIVVVPAGAPEIVLTLHVGPNAGAVRITAGETPTELTMAAEETRTVAIPVPAGSKYVRVGAQAARDFRPSDVNQGSADMRRLGVQVRVEVR